MLEGHFGHPRIDLAEIQSIHVRCDFIPGSVFAKIDDDGSPAGLQDSQHFGKSHRGPRRKDVAELTENHVEFASAKLQLFYVAFAPFNLNVGYASIEARPI